MGKQLIFYMTAKDEAEFLRALGDVAPYRLIRNTFRDATAMDVHTPLPISEHRDDTYLSLCQEGVDTRLRTEFVDEQNVFCVDLMESEAIEFSRCYFSGKHLLNGRLWFEERRSNGKKRKVFIDWANNVLRLLKRMYHRDPEKGYIGFDALAALRAGRLYVGPEDLPTLWRQHPPK